MYRLLLEAGIDCRVISGDDQGWNIVKLDGIYYYLDATWTVRRHSQPTTGFLQGASDFWDRGHTPDPMFGTAEFMSQYPISEINYGAPATITASGVCGDNATWELSEDGTLTILGTGDMWDHYAYDWENYYVWSKNNYIKKIVVSSGITSIGAEAFMNCQAATSVTIADTVTQIGDRAFKLCTKLTEIKFPDSVTQLGEEVFSYCYSLKDVTLPATLDELSPKAFSCCIALESIDLPATLKIIGAEALSTCIDLQSLTIPDAVETIGDFAFAASFDPDAEVKLIIPAGVKKIGIGTF